VQQQPILHVHLIEWMLISLWISCRVKVSFTRPRAASV